MCCLLRKIPGKGKFRYRAFAKTPSFLPLREGPGPGSSLFQQTLGMNERGSKQEAAPGDPFPKAANSLKGRSPCGKNATLASSSHLLYPTKLGLEGDPQTAMLVPGSKTTLVVETAFGDLQLHAV